MYYPRLPSFTLVSPYFSRIATGSGRGGFNHEAYKGDFGGLVILSHSTRRHLFGLSMQSDAERWVK